MHQLRASHLRATFKEFHALPSSENFACIWEARVLRNISTQWFCMKSSVKFIINLSVFSFRSTHTHFPLAGEDWRRYASSYHTYQTEVLSSVQDWAKSHDCNLLAVIGLGFFSFLRDLPGADRRHSALQQKTWSSNCFKDLCFSCAHAFKWTFFLIHIFFCLKDLDREVTSHCVQSTYPVLAAVLGKWISDA